MNGSKKNGRRVNGRPVFRLALLCLGIAAAAASLWMAHAEQAKSTVAARARDALRLDLTDTLISSRDFRDAASRYLANPSREKIGPVSEAEWRLRDRLNVWRAMPAAKDPAVGGAKTNGGADTGGGCRAG